jgi:hypothetical protein
VGRLNKVTSKLCRVCPSEVGEHFQNCRLHCHRCQQGKQPQGVAIMEEGGNVGYNPDYDREREDQESKVANSDVPRWLPMIRGWIMVALRISWL